MMKRLSKWASVLVALSLVIGLPLLASAQKEDPMELANDGVVIPYFNSTSGNSSFLIVNCAGSSCDTTNPSGATPPVAEPIRLRFYDKSCTEVQNNILNLTENQGAVIKSLASPLTTITEGSILIGNPKDAAGNKTLLNGGFAMVAWIDSAADKIRFIEPTTNNSGSDWTPYDAAHFIPVAFPDDGTTFKQTLLLQCPTGGVVGAPPTNTITGTPGTLGGDMTADFNTPIVAPTNIAITVFDNDEKELFSIDTNRCKCNLAAFGSTDATKGATQTRLSAIDARFALAGDKYVEMTSEANTPLAVPHEWWAYLITDASVSGLDLELAHRLPHASTVAP